VPGPPRSRPVCEQEKAGTFADSDLSGRRDAFAQIGIHQLSPAADVTKADDVAELMQYHAALCGAGTKATRQRCTGGAVEDGIDVQLEDAADKNVVDPQRTPAPHHNDIVTRVGALPGSQRRPADEEQRPALAVAIRLVRLATDC